MPKVLIIESETSVAQSLTDAFSDRGAEVIVTGDGSEAITRARSDNPDLIVLCVELSRGSGYSVCNKLKKDPGLSAIPLILTSSQATEETFEQHKKLRTRAEAYLKKPYGTNRLVQIAAGYIDLGPGPAGGDEVEVSVDDVSAVDADEEFDVSIDDDSDVSLEALTGALDQPVAATTVMTANQVAAAVAGGAAEDDADAIHSFSDPPTQVLLSDAEAERMRGEIRQLRQKVQRLEQTLQEKELEFNDRLLEESARARDAVDIKKKLAQVEREISRHQQAAERAEAEVVKLKGELKASQSDVSQTESERQVLSEKIGQLVDKVKSLAAERDQLQGELLDARKAKAEADTELEHAAKVRDKAKKAVEIAVQLIDETGLAH